MAHTNDVTRPLANYPQDIWGDHLLSLPFNHEELECYTNQLKGLKETVKDMVMVPTTDLMEKMHLIYSLCRLGVSYHFENEIEEQLNHLFIRLPGLLDDKDYDLHTVAMVFQVFRLNGYKMPCGLEEADQRTYAWMVNNNNKLPRALRVLTRLYNDIVTNEAEEKRGLVTGSACYMKQYKVFLSLKPSIDIYELFQKSPNQKRFKQS
ncbi:hypothetical protein V6N13_047543 [Hibiscus sabdariffa]